MEITDELRELILVGASALEIRRKAIEEGMITLRGSGLRKIKDGVTTHRRSAQRNGEDNPWRRFQICSSKPSNSLARTCTCRSARPPQVRVHGELQRLQHARSDADRHQDAVVQPC